MADQEEEERMKQAQELKAKGNAAFSSAEHDQAIAHYTQAIKLDKGNHVLYSNRAACHLALAQYDKALADAKACIQLNDAWPKGYSRCAQALRFLGQLDEAVAILETGLQRESASGGGSPLLRPDLGEMKRFQSQWAQSQRLEESGLASYKRDGISSSAVTESWTPHGHSSEYSLPKDPLALS